MGKVQERSEKSSFFPKGGTTKMYGRGTAHEAVPDYSGKQKNDGEEGSEGPKNRKGELESYAKGFTFPKGGGSNEMFGKGHAGKKVPGVSGKESQEG